MFSSGSNSNVFVIESINKTLPPKHYGYHSFQWAVDNANTTANAYANLPQFGTADEPSLIERFKHDTSRLCWQLTGLFSAIYLLYPQIVLQVPLNVLEEISKGIKDGVDGLRNANGPLLPEFKKGMQLLVLEYRKALFADYKESESQDPNGYYPDGFNTFKLFKRYVCEAYSSNVNVEEYFSQLELSSLQPQVDGLLGDCLLAIRDETKIRYVA